MTFREVVLDIPRDLFDAVDEARTDSIKLLGLPARTSLPEWCIYVLSVGRDEIEKRLNKAKAPHIITP